MKMNLVVDKVSQFFELIPPTAIILCLLIPSISSSVQLIKKDFKRKLEMDMDQENHQDGGGKKNRKKKGGQNQNQNQNATATHTNKVDVEIPPPPQSPLGDDVTGKDLPLLGSREAERNLLILLNKRFEKIIEKNRKLQQDNNQLESQLEIQQLECSSKVTEITSKVNGQLDQTREELAAAKKEISVLTFTVEAAKKGNEDLKARLDNAVDEIERQKKQIGDLEGQVDKLNSQLKNEAEQKHKVERELKEWREQAIREGETLQETKTQLEKETFIRLDLERELNSKLDEGTLKATLIETEMVQLKASQTKLLNDQNEKQQKEFENKLENKLKSLRDEYNQKLAENKDEQAKLYGLKEADHIAKKEALNQDIKDKENQLKDGQLKIKDLTEKVRTLEGERHALLVQLDDLETEKKAEKEKLEKEIQNRDKLLQIKIDEKNELVNECQHLLDVKVALDNELATYRALLETEESRLELGAFGKKDENQNFVSGQPQTV